MNINSTFQFEKVGKIQNLGNVVYMMMFISAGFPFVMSRVAAKIRYYKDVTLCENYVRDFFIAAILPVSVKCNAINLLILKMQRHQSRRHFGSK